MQTVQATFPGFGKALDEKVERSIAVLQNYEPKADTLDPGLGYWGCDSGGKDSCCIIELAKQAHVNITWHYNVTTIDPPEVCRFIRKSHPETVWERAPRSFFDLLADERGYPTRIGRWCCQVFKESSGLGKVKVTGVRWAESPRRRQMWKQFQRFDPTRSHGSSGLVSFMVNPIVDWTNDDVWQFIRGNSIPYCRLYDEGFTRIGCIGCPMSGAATIKRDFERWPAFRDGWLRAFERLWNRRRPTVLTRGKRKGKQWPGLPEITTPLQLFDWWKSGLAPQEDDQGCQLGLW